MKRVMWIIVSLFFYSQGAMAAATSASISDPDAAFLNEAALGGMFEIQASQLALQKASDPSVKGLAQLLLSQHRDMDASLKRLAASKSHSLPAELDDKHRNLIGDMQQKDADDFDRFFIEQAGIKTHEQAIHSFRSAVERARDLEIKQFASSQLESLQNHLDRARNIERMLGDAERDGADGNKEDKGLPPMPSTAPAAQPEGTDGSGAQSTPQPAPGTPSKDAESQ